MVTFLLDFFRINLTNNIIVIVVIGTGIIVMLYVKQKFNEIQKN